MTAPSVLLDSTVLIDFLNGRPKAIEKIKKLEEKNTSCFTTQINVFELVFGVFANSRRIEDELLALNVLLSKLKVLDVTLLSAHLAGKLAGELKRKGIVLHAGDALIAGTALANQIPVIVTKDTKDFSKIRSIRIETY